MHTIIYAVAHTRRPSHRNMHLVSGNTWVMEECLTLGLSKHTITVYYSAASCNTVWYTGTSQEKRWLVAQSSSPPQSVSFLVE